MLSVVTAVSGYGQGVGVALLPAFVGTANHNRVEPATSASTQRFRFIELIEFMIWRSPALSGRNVRSVEVPAPEASFFSLKRMILGFFYNLVPGGGWLRRRAINSIARCSTSRASLDFCATFSSASIRRGLETAWPVFSSPISI